MIPLFIFSTLGITSCGWQLYADVLLRSVPFQILYWGIVVSIMCFLIWIISRLKKIQILFYIILTMAFILSFPYIALFSAMRYEPEHVVERNGIRMVARVNSFLDTRVNYYEDKNILFHGSKPLGYEYYGNGCFDPFKKDGIKRKPLQYDFYDLNGNLLESSESGKK